MLRRLTAAFTGHTHPMGEGNRPMGEGGVDLSPFEAEREKAEL
jgi:hypothetical protein